MKLFSKSVALFNIYIVFKKVIIVKAVVLTNPGNFAKLGLGRMLLKTYQFKLLCYK